MAAPALAQDWGYDSMIKPQQKATPKAEPTVKNFEAGGRSDEKKVELNKTESKKVQSKPLANAQSDAQGKAQIKEQKSRELSTVDCWMELFAVCASSPSDDDRKILTTLGTIPDQEKGELREFLNSREKLQAYSSLKPIWMQLRTKVLQELDYKDSYRLLFRALLRHALGDSRTNLSAEQKATIQNLMGPSRISEPGPPVLTEDAINAYADMTCFLFQRRKPDRSIDGQENRQVFADVIKQRYQQAPNLQAKTAMCNFDLTWACFRCRYLAMDEEGRARLSKLMAAGGGKELKAELTNAEILKIFAIGPWSEKNAVAQQTAPPEEARAQALPLK